MKCDTVRDLLPLYVDGLTSETSAKAIKEHLKKCKECQKYYNEMVGDLSDVVPKAEVDDVSLIRKVHKKRKITKGVAAGVIGMLCIVICIMLWFWWPTSVKYQDVDLSYEKSGSMVRVELSPGSGTNIMFNGSAQKIKDESGKEIGTRSHLKVISSTRMLKGETGNSCQWEAVLENEDQVYEWVFEFADRTVTIRNGELVSNTKK